MPVGLPRVVEAKGKHARIDARLSATHGRTEHGVDPFHLRIAHRVATDRLAASIHRVEMAAASARAADAFG